MSFISFLTQGSKCPLFQEMQLDKQLSQVTITLGEDHRTIEQIKKNDIYPVHSQYRHSIIARNEDSLITIDYDCIGRAEQIWRKVYLHILCALSANAAVLAGLFTLRLSGVVTTRYIVLAQLAVACFFIFVLARADEIYQNKPLFPKHFDNYNSNITLFRKEVIEREWEHPEFVKEILPDALQERAMEFFTENEKKLLNLSNFKKV